MYFREAFTNLVVTKLRTMLAMIGILVGTASVVAMVSSGELATAAALAQFKALGTDMLAMSLYSQGSGNTAEKKELSLPEAMAMQKLSPNIILVAPYVMLFVPVSYAGNTLNANIIGATQSLAKGINLKMQMGRFISDLDKNANYCVLGNAVYKNLDPPLTHPLGTQIKLGSDIFTIIGVIDNWPESSFFNQDVNNSIFVPLKTAQLLTKYATIDNILFHLKENSDIDIVKQKITQYVTAVVPDRQVSFHSAKELIKSVTAQRQIFTLLLGLIGSISLLVGGIGVMNIMLVSVLERRREIGIRLALGARRKDIQWMFLSEAMLLSLVGGMLGILVGITVSFIIAKFANWGFEIFWLPPLIGFSVSLIVGVFFGYYPARQASLLDPIVTLRAE